MQAFIRISLFSFMLIVATITSAHEIILQPRATVAGNVVRLGDIAQFQTDAASQAQLAALEIGPSPAAGGPKVYRQREIQDRLSLLGVNLAAVRFSGANQVNLAEEKIVAPTLNFNQRQSVNRAVAQAVERTMREQNEGLLLYQVEALLTDEQLASLPLGQHLIKVTSKIQPVPGEQTVTLETLGKKPIKLSITVKLSDLPQYWTTIHTINRGAIITAADLERKPATGIVPANAMTDIDQIVGRETTRTLAVGQTIDPGALRQPTLVRKGEVVDLHVLSGGVKISTKARAKAEGGQGDLIPLEVLNNKEPVLGRVSGFQTAEILGSASR
jgi:flagella basal body P-ring formation protein FlgA